MESILGFLHTAALSTRFLFWLEFKMGHYTFFNLRDLFLPLKVFNFKKMLFDMANALNSSLNTLAATWLTLTQVWRRPACDGVLPSVLITVCLSGFLTGLFSVSTSVWLTCVCTQDVDLCKFRLITYQAYLFLEVAWAFGDPVTLLAESCCSVDSATNFTRSLHKWFALLGLKTFNRLEKCYFSVTLQMSRTFFFLY